MRRSRNAIRRQRASSETIAAKDMEKISGQDFADEVRAIWKSLFHGLSAKPQTVKALKALKINLAYACGLVEWLMLKKLGGEVGLK
jgi:hypothetical protein